MTQDWLNISVLHIPLIRWVLFISILFIAVIAQRILMKGFRKITASLASHTDTDLDDLLFAAAEKPAGWFILLIGIIAAVFVLNPPADIWPIWSPLSKIAKIIALFLAFWFLWRLVDGLAAYFTEVATQTDSSLDDQLVPFISKTIKLFLLVTTILVAAQNIGYSISGLIASLGIGGIALAMAAKDTLANVFGSLMILIDRPFTVGDWIKTAEFEGVVEEVGFRSTRIRTFAKTLVNVPNSSLANMVIDNIDAMPKRRVKMRIGLTYNTKTEQMQKALDGIEAILASHPGVDQEFHLVNFDEFADSSLDIFIYYFTRSTHWKEYLAVRQSVNLEIIDLLESLNLEFAFPSRSVYLHRMGPEEAGT